MNPDLLPPVEPKPNTNITATKSETATVKKQPESGSVTADKKSDSQKSKLPPLRNLPKSVLLLIGLVSLTLLLLVAVLFIPKKGTNSNTETISTESIPEPKISIPSSQETKQTPFTQEIVDFKKDSGELNFDYSMYNLPVVDTEFNLTK